MAAGRKTSKNNIDSIEINIGEDDNQFELDFSIHFDFTIVLSSCAIQLVSSNFLDSASKVSSLWGFP